MNDEPYYAVDNWIAQGEEPLYRLTIPGNAQLVADQLNNLTEERDKARATVEAQAATIAAQAARLEAVRGLCFDPGGPYSWTHTFQGRPSIFVDDIIAVAAPTGEATS